VGSAYALSMVRRREQSRESLGGRYAGTAVHLARRSNEPAYQPFDNEGEAFKDDAAFNGDAAPFLDARCPVRQCAWSSSLVERELAVEGLAVHFRGAHPEHRGQGERW
jgi:hypothetical protein